MKKGVIGVFMLAVLVFSALSFVSAAIPEGCESSMIAYWKLDGNAEDSYINSFDGSGSVTYEAFKISSGVKFSGTNKISIPDASPLDLTNGFTIQFWFKKVSSSVYKNATLVKKGNYEIKWTFPSDYSGSFIESSVGGSKLNSQKLALRNTPYFVSLTWNKGTGKLTLYINGAKSAEGTVSSMGETTTSLEFGENFEGLMDEIAFYNVPFDNSTVKRYYDTSSLGRDYCYSAGAGGSSKTVTNFTIAGCDLPNGDKLAAGSCSLWYYCGNVSLILYNTLIDNLGCSYEQTELPVDDLRGCCPPGYYCNTTEPGTQITCIQSTWTCAGLTKDGKDACEEHFCYWVDTGVESENYCTDDLNGLGCSVYKNPTYCANDYLELGTLGYGTEDCRDEEIPIECEDKTFVLDGCQCSWNPTGGASGSGGCELLQKISSDFFNETTNYTFACSKFFGMGDCVEGEQAVNWTATLKDTTTGATPTASQLLMDCVSNAARCKSGATTRFCGEEVVKLPGFSLFALITSITVIGLFYLFRIKR